jgi:hypothetical protein
MSQDFSDLGIEIEDFLADLTKIRQEELLAFDTFNKWVQKTDQAPITSNIFENSNITSPTTTPKTSNNLPQPSITLMDKFVKTSEYSSSTPPQLDKPIILKSKLSRKHIHRYDLRIGIKECRSEEDEQQLLQELLEEFLETMLSADKTIIIPPYYKLDRANTAFTDISSSFRIADVESFTKLKRYFSRLGNRNPNTGFVYCSCIVAASEPHTALMTKVSQILQESKLSLWPRSSDHENVGRIGWLLYSLQDMDASRLKTLLTSLTGVEIGVKWMKISSDFGSKCTASAAHDEPTKAFVLEGPSDQIYELRETLSNWYGS